MLKKIKNALNDSKIIKSIQAKWNYFLDNSEIAKKIVKKLQELHDNYAFIQAIWKRKEIVFSLLGIFLVVIICICISGESEEEKAIMGAKEQATQLIKQQEALITKQLQKVTKIIFLLT